MGQIFANTSGELLFVDITCVIITRWRCNSQKATSMERFFSSNSFLFSCSPHIYLLSFLVSFFGSTFDAGFILSSSELLSSDSDELESLVSFLLGVVDVLVDNWLLLLSLSSSELLSSEDELLAVFDFASGCFGLVLRGVSSSELLSSEELESFLVDFWEGALVSTFVFTSFPFSLSSSDELSSEEDESFALDSPEITRTTI